MNTLFTDRVMTALHDHRHVLDQLTPLVPQIVEAGLRMRACLQLRGKILLMGNGGSAADSQHIAAEIVGRYRRERAAMPAIALSTDTSVLTSVGNDYGYDSVFSRQIEAYCYPDDLVIGISTSGNSTNVVKAIETARQMNAYTLGLTGAVESKLSQLCTQTIRVPSTDTPRIQEMHILIGHMLCDIVDQC